MEQQAHMKLVAKVRWQVKKSLEERILEKRRDGRNTRESTGGRETKRGEGKGREAGKKKRFEVHELIKERGWKRNN